MKRIFVFLIPIVTLLLISTEQAPVVAEPEIGPELGAAFSQFMGGNDPNYGCLDCCSSFCRGFCNPGGDGFAAIVNGNTSSCECQCFEYDHQGNAVTVFHRTNHCLNAGRCG